MRKAFTAIEILVGVAVIVIVLAIVGRVGFSVVNNFHTESGVVFTVSNKENVVHNKSSKYLVYTDKTTYEITDTWLHGRWNSSDVYGKITTGKTYTCTLQGYRVPFFSMYPNIIDPKEVTSTPEKGK